MTYESSASYDGPSFYSSGHMKPKYVVKGLCRGTCRTSYGCSCS